MHGISLHPAHRESQSDPAAECERLEPLLALRRAELGALRERFRDFKLLYARKVGGPLAELAEVEDAVRAAEARLLGSELLEEADGGEAPVDFYAPPPHGRVSLKKLFWSVARLFHPDHAADVVEAGRRHAIMAEASRAYRDGDVDSLHTLLGDEQLRFYCASAAREGGPGGAAERLLDLKEELRTIEFGIKRIHQDGLYRLMLSAEEGARQGRDVLAEMAAGVGRKIRKARNRLEHLS